MIQQKVLDDILLERKNQIAQWGGAEGDDRNESFDWFIYIRHQLELAEDEYSGYVSINDTAQERLTKIAALAIAALESMERKNNKK